MRYLLLCLLLVISGVVSAQTETPTPTFTVSTSPYIFATVETGQMTRFDYVITAGSVHIANVLTLIFFSLWGMFLFAVFVYVKRRQS